MKLTHKKSFKGFFKAFSLVFKSAPKLTLANFVVTFIQGVFPLIIIYLIKELIDTVSFTLDAADKAEAFTAVVRIIVLTGIAYLVNILATTLAQLIREYQGQFFSDLMYDRLHQKAVGLDLAFFENPHYHDMFYRALQEAPYRPVKIVNSIFYMFQSLFVLSILGALLISLHWTIAFVLLAAILPLGWIRIKYAKITYKWQKDNTQNERRAYYYSRILTNDVFAKELRLFGLAAYFQKGFKEVKAHLINSKLSILKKKTLWESFSHIFSTIAVFSAYAFVAYKAVFDNLSIGALVMYYMALQKGMSFFKEFLNSFSSLYEDNLYVENLSDFLSLENKIDYSDGKNNFPKKLKEGITLKNVCFKYPNSKRNALENINMHIKAGTTVAIVGDNGAGKTTLVKLICHLYEPDTGDIIFDKISVKEINDKEIKNNISVLFQDFVLYHLSVKDNIRFGNLNNSLSEEKITHAAQQAGIADVIEKLHLKYDTVLGKLFDNSEELSLGEWQKMALARAFFKDSPIIILDEPTSSLDPMAEAEIFGKFKDIVKNKTGIIISHRFSTVKMADYIYVMEKESIVEEGTHEQLMQKNGKYAHMYNLSRLKI